MSSIAAASVGRIRLTLKEKFSYGLGDFGNGFMFDLGQAYLLKFYTDVAGLPGSVAAGVFVFTKIFDAFMDPIAGSFIDNRRRIGRNGRFRPVMFYSSIVLALLTIFTFLTPGAAQAANLAFAYVSYMLWGVLYSFTNVPYGSLGSVLTQDAQERSQLASWRQAGSVGALLITGVVFVPIADAFGDPRIGYPVAAGILAAVGVGAFWLTFRNTSERVPVIRTERRFNAREFARAIGTNRPLLVMILMTVFSISAYNVKTAMVVYFTQYYLNDKSVLPYVNFISIGASVVGILAMPALARRFGKRNTAILGFGIAAVADGLNFFLPGTTTWSFTILLAISFIGVAIPNGMTWAMISDSIDYGHWKNGQRQEGITYSMFNFSRKIAQSIAGGLAGFGLTLVGYVPNVAQSAGAALGIKGIQALYPAIAFAIAGLVLWFLYPLTDTRHRELVEEIHVREAEAVAD
ncbi:glycoside-pentoside-hexuronide (GPH):cation symporter [Tersicoccus sp. MR15.9]|uniref:glycoside-pentoside-hexuronide (GPH):cation symporter n=1 Tax=Tersicoccus mangrovi TaxID=3121635 RepID=UPI002FE57BE6